MSELSLIKFSPKSFLHVLNEYNFPDWYMFLLFCFARNPGEPRDRTGNLLNPFKIDSKYKITIPNDLSGGTNIIQYMEDRASEIETIANGKYLDLFLSGGFDSVAVYATLIKICDVSKIRACFWYSDDTSDKKALNQFNPELYNYIISNKYNYRLLNNSQLHADDAVSIIGHPGNFISGTNVKNYVSKTRINGIITTLHSKIINGDYDNKSWEELITDIGNNIKDQELNDFNESFNFNIAKVVEQLAPVFNSCPVDISGDAIKTLWWFKFSMGYSDRVLGPWYLMKNLSTDRADQVFPFYHGDNFQKYMINVCLNQKKYIHPPHNRNDELREYMLDFYSDSKIVENTINLDNVIGLVHSKETRGVMRLNNGEVLDTNEYLERESELKSIFYQ